jgi:hypothetical protein
MSTPFLNYFLKDMSGTCKNNVRMAENKTERLDMRIPATLKAESIAVARIEKRSLSNLIEVLLQDAIDQKKATDPRRFREELSLVLQAEEAAPRFTPVTKPPKGELSNETKTKTPLRKVK